ncbi:hypothetical protein SEUCBS139899_000709 [Sporothrix eucalyptigena]|uniref:DUF8035 domain-containing protein n=1 Tax=Sporothrix eucalyptigena TaxID=1812306 RepID=A0ABP0AUP5_9PEZI
MSRDYDRRDRRYEEEDDEILTYERRRHAPRLRERSPTPPDRRGGGRVIEDERIVQRDRRYFEHEEDNDSVILPSAARRRNPPPAVIPEDLDSNFSSGSRRRASPPPPRPGRLIRRQSSVETFDRRPARRAYELDRIDHDRDHELGRPPVNVPIPLPIRRRRDSSAERHEREYYERERETRERERERGRERRDTTTEIEEIRIEPGRYEEDDFEIRRRRERDERDERERLDRLERLGRLERNGREREHDRVVETERVEKSTFREEERRGRPFRETETDERLRREVMVRAPSIVSEGSGHSRSRSRSSGGVTLRSGRGDRDGPAKSEYPKKGKTRMPARLVSEQVLIDLGYPFIREGNTLVLQVALGQDNIDDVLKLSRDYKKSQTEVVESKTTKVKTSGGTVIEEERRREEIYMTPAAPAPPPPPPVQYQPQYQPQQVVYSPPPIPPPAPYAPVVVPAPSPVMAPEPAYNKTTVHIRDVSPARSYAQSVYAPEVATTALVRTSGLQPPVAPVIYDAPSPAAELTEEAAVGPLAVVAIDSDRVRVRSKSRHRSRHSRHRSHSTHYHRHSRSHSHGDGALYAHFHDSRDRDRDDRYYYEERDYYDSASTGRELVRAERLSTGELVLYQEEVERIEEPRYGVRIEKDKKGRMAISVPKYR